MKKEGELPPLFILTLLFYFKEDKLLKGKVEIKSADSLGTPQGGAIGMSRLTSVDKAVYTLVGFTGVSKAAAPIGQRAKAMMIGMRGKPRPSDLVAQQPLGEAAELGRGRIARTPSASFVG